MRGACPRPGPAARRRRPRRRPLPAPHLPGRGRHQPRCSAGREEAGAAAPRRVTGAAAPAQEGPAAAPLVGRGRRVGGSRRAGDGDRHGDRSGAGAAPPLLLRGGASPADWGNPFVRSDGGSRGEAGRERGRRRHERALSERAAPRPAPTGAAGGRAGAAPLAGAGRCLRRLHPLRGGGGSAGRRGRLPPKLGRFGTRGAGPVLGRARGAAPGVRPRRWQSPARRAGGPGRWRGRGSPWSGCAGWDARRGVLRQVCQPEGRPGCPSSARWRVGPGAPGRSSVTGEARADARADLKRFSFSQRHPLKLQPGGALVGDPKAETPPPAGRGAGCEGGGGPAGRCGRGLRGRGWAPGELFSIGLGRSSSAMNI